MVTLTLFALTSVALGASGLMMILFPTIGIRFMKSAVEDPWRRFWLTQSMLLIGLILIIGTTSLHGGWIWVIIGAISVAKACLLLGSTSSFRERLMETITTWPLVIYRCGGIVNLVLAVTFAADVILHA